MTKTYTDYAIEVTRTGYDVRGERWTGFNVTAPLDFMIASGERQQAIDQVDSFIDQLKKIRSRLEEM